MHILLIVTLVLLESKVSILLTLVLVQVFLYVSYKERFLKSLKNMPQSLVVEALLKNPPTEVLLICSLTLSKVFIEEVSKQYTISDQVFKAYQRYIWGSSAFLLLTLLLPRRVQQHLLQRMVATSILSH